MPNKNHKIVLIGAGNVATQLGLALKKAQHNILQVVSLHPSSAEELATKLKSKFTTHPEKINLSADIYIIAVNDKAISKVVKYLKTENKIIVHTSGATDMNVLRKASDNYGVFYPLQTFSKNRTIDFSNVPIILEASNEKTFDTLQQLGNSISKNDVKGANSKKRKAIHLAAVFANNFTNHMFAIAESILSEHAEGIDLLIPLIKETSAKIEERSPVFMQTGPAIRGDKKTMKAHLKLLTENRDYQKIYELLSKSIIKSKQKNK